MRDELRFGAPLPPAEHVELVREIVRTVGAANLDAGGRLQLAPFPLLVSAELRTRLHRLAEELDAEALEAEAAIQGTRRALGRLGLPALLHHDVTRHAARARPRAVRYDFHPTAAGGLAITEGNTDVAGGWSEAGAVTRLVAEAHGGRSHGDPEDALAGSLKEASEGRGSIVLVHLGRHAEDLQVLRSLKLALARRGATASLRPVGAVPRSTGIGFRYVAAEQVWTRAFDPAVPWCNPLTTVLSQSKRFPLAWERARVPMPTWRRLLPDTVDVREVPPGARADWVIKAALSHEGRDVLVPGVATDEALDEAWARARRRPRSWCAQRRFESAALAAPDGPAHVALGVHVVDGRAHGLYARISTRPRLDVKARHAVVLEAP